MSIKAECVKLMEAFQYVDDKFLDIVEQQKKIRKKKHIREMFAAAAAGISLFLVLPAMAMAYNWLGFRDLLLPKQREETASLTLWEYMYRPETRAVMDWKNSGYDREENILSETEKESFEAEGRRDWILYGVSSREMGEKLDEIVGKYKLKLHTDREIISVQTLESMIGGQLLEEAHKENVLLYEDGSFQFEGSMILEEGRTVDFRFRCAVKGSFDEDAPFYWGDEEDEETQYIPAWGEPVLLALGNSRTLIYAELDEFLVTIDMACGKECGITWNDLQSLADRVDFGMLQEGYTTKAENDFTVSPNDTITMSGYPDSPEAMALAEWKAFLEEYDKDGKILEELNNDIFIVEGREDWFLYNVYSMEMGEKLDEIAGRYGLKLHTKINVVSPKEMNYRVGGSFLDESCTQQTGYIYENGTFKSEAEVTLDGCGMTFLTVKRTVKGTFDEATWNIGDANDYTDWQYMSASGETVTLSLGHIRAFIFGDFEECFVLAGALAGRNEGMTKEDLQALADKIDFQRLKEVQEPDMRGDSLPPFLE